MTRSRSTNRFSSMVTVIVCAVGFSAAMTEQARGQLHGIAIAKGCLGPVCEGELTDCTINFGYSDDAGDTLKIHAAWDVQDVTGKKARIPAAGAEIIGDLFSSGKSIGDDDGICEDNEVCEGNLAIVAVAGNTTCVVGGSLPCAIGPGGSPVRWYVL